jgi:hypothetical protein
MYATNNDIKIALKLQANIIQGSVLMSRERHFTYTVRLNTKVKGCIF